MLKELESVVPLNKIQVDIVAGVFHKLNISLTYRTQSCASTRLNFIFLKGGCIAQWIAKLLHLWTEAY